MRIDLAKLSSRDRLIVGGALVAFIAAFLPWWGVNLGIADFGGGSLGVSVDGWSAGFTAWAGSALLTAAGVYLLLRRSDFGLSAPAFGEARLVLILAGLGLILVVIRWLSLPSYRGIDVGARYGIWIALIAGAVETLAAFDEARTSSPPATSG